jgi:copper oxidase (laccase) domain-containing protein
MRAMVAGSTIQAVIGLTVRPMRYEVSQDFYQTFVSQDMAMRAFLHMRIAYNLVDLAMSPID